MTTKPTNYIDVQQAVADAFKAANLLGPKAAYQTYDPVLAVDQVLNQESFHGGAALVAVSRVLGLNTDAQRTVVHSLEMGVFLIAPKARPRHREALTSQLLFQALGVIDGNRWGQAGASDLEALRAAPLVSPELIEDGIHIWAVQWRQNFKFFDKASIPLTVQDRDEQRRQALGFHGGASHESI